MSVPDGSKLQAVANQALQHAGKPRSGQRKDMPATITAAALADQSDTYIQDIINQLGGWVR